MIKKSIVLCGLFAFTTLACAATIPAQRNYKLSELDLVVSNSPECSAVYNSLKVLKKPFSLSFTRDVQTTGQYDVTDNKNQLQGHDYSIAQQNTSGQAVSRVILGHFMLKDHRIDYVLDIAGDASQANFKYRYPIILSSNSAHCFFTAMVKPDAATQAAFKATIASGDVAAQTDMAK